MKKKDSQDSQKVADLLKKLQASYLGKEEKVSKKKKDLSDEDDQKFREKLAAMLGKATSAPAKKDDAPKKEIPVMAQENEALPEPEEIASSPTPPSEAETVTEEKTAPKAAVSKPKKKKAATKKAKPTKQETPPVAEPTIEETVEPIVEEQAVEETVVEEPIIEEPIVAETVVEEPIIEEPIVEETPLEEPIIEEPIVEETALEEPVIEEAVLEEPAEAPTEVESVKPPQETELEPVIVRSPKITIASPVQTRSESTAQEKPKSVTPPALEPTEQEAPKPVTQAALEPTEQETPKPVTQAALEPTESEVPAPVVVIKPKVEPQKPNTAPAAEKKQEQPIRIVPNVTVPRSSNAPDFAKPKQTRDPDSIVIRPRTHGQPKTETIVIRPRVADKPKPTPEIKQDAISSTPIKIGKEIRSDTKAETAPTLSESPKPIMKKEQNTTFVPPTPIAEAEPIKISPKKATSKKATATEEAITAPPKKPSVTLPRGGKKQPSDEQAAPEKPQRKKMRRVINSIPVTTLADDDSLEEVLDEDLTLDTQIEEIPMDEPEEIATQPQKLSIFERRQRQKQKQAEEKLSALEVIRRRSGLDEDDLAMIFELGYENELGRLVGYENLKRMRTEHLKRVSQTNRHHYRMALGYRGEEYAGRHQRDSILAAYVHDRKRLILRLLLTSLLSLLLLFLDMPSLVGASLTNLDASYPLLLPIMGILLLSLTAALSWRQINAGLRRLFKFAPTPYTVPALLLPIAVVYDLISLFTSANVLHVNFLVSLSFLVMTVCDVLRLSCEMRTLRILAAEGEKTVLAPAVPRKKKLRQGDKIVKIVNDDVGENRYQVRSATETVGFFRRFNAMDSAARPFTILIAAMLGLATVIAFVDAVCTRSIASALSSFMTVLLLGAPLSSCFGFFYPLCRANRLLSRRNCALVGEEAVEEFDAPKTLIFRDTALYTAEKCTEISVREGDDFRNDLRLAAILFRKLGGTLEPIGQSTPAPTKADPPVSVVRIQDTGVEAMVDNRYHVLAGSAEFLRRGGVRVPKESTDKALRRTANVSLMYVAIDGVLKLSYEIEYRTKSAFEHLIRDLADTGSAVAIQSYDPNLSDAFLQRSRAENAETVRTVKPGRFEEDKPLDIADTGAVALGDPTDVAYPLHAAAEIGMLRRFGLRMQLIATLLGGAAVAILSLLGQSGLFGIVPIAVYQAFWITVTAVATGTELTAEKLHLR